MKKILTVLTVIVFTIVSCQKEEPVEPQPRATVQPTGNGGTTAGIDSLKFFVGMSVDNNVYLIDEPVVTINGVTLAYVGENYNVNNVNDGVIDRAFEYYIPTNLVSCNDSIDYNITFTDNDIVGVTIFDIQVFSSMSGTSIESISEPWGSFTTWEEPTSVPYDIIKTDKIQYICN